MRLLTINLLAAALLFLSAAQAGAYRMWLAPAGPIVAAASDTITVDVHLDTQGQSNITILAGAVVYDTTALTYLPGSSSTPTYILYSPQLGGTTPSAWLEPKVPAPSTVSYNPPLEVVPGIVVTGWVEPSLGATQATTADLIIATLAFHVAASTQISLQVGPAGTVVQLGDGTRPVVDTGAPVDVIVPEPTTALLVGLGLLGLGVAGRRNS